MIAEAGSNHAGSKSLALTLVDEAAKAGADAIKFQLFRWEDVSQVPKLQEPRFELPVEWLPDLRDRAHSRGLAFLCTPFAPWAVEALDPFVDAWKIGSFEAMRWDLWNEVRRLQHDRVIFYSLGRCEDEHMRVLFNKGGRVWGTVPLHCTSVYPTPYTTLYFSRLEEIRKRQEHWGYSSHTADWTDVILAVAFGAEVIEKHIKLVDQPPTPDSIEHSLLPAQFSTMVKAIRDSEIALRQRRWAMPPCPWGRKEHGY